MQTEQIVHFHFWTILMESSIWNANFNTLEWVGPTQLILWELRALLWNYLSITLAFHPTEMTLYYIKVLTKRQSNCGVALAKKKKKNLWCCFSWELELNNEKEHVLGLHSSHGSNVYPFIQWSTTNLAALASMLPSMCTILYINSHPL